MLVNFLLYIGQRCLSNLRWNNNFWYSTTEHKLFMVSRSFNWLIFRISIPVVLYVNFSPLKSGLDMTWLSKVFLGSILLYPSFFTKLRTDVFQISTEDSSLINFTFDFGTRKMFVPFKRRLISSATFGGCPDTEPYCKYFLW